MSSQTVFLTHLILGYVPWLLSVRVDLPAVAGELRAMYAFPIIYMPLQMITHLAAFYLFARSRSNAVSSLAGDAAASPGPRD